MGLLELLSGIINPGAANGAEPPPQFSMGPFDIAAPAPTQAAPAPASTEDDPGLLARLGIKLDSDKRDTIKRALATPIENSPFPLQAGWNGMSSALKGGNTYEDEQATAQAAADKEEADRKIKQLGLDNLHKYHMGSLGVAQQRAGTDEQYRRDMADAALGRADASGVRADTDAKVKPRALDIREKQVEGQLGIGNRNADTRERQVDVNTQNAETRARGVDVRDWARQDLDRFRGRQGDIGQQNADARTMDATTRRDKPSSWNKPPEQLMLDVERTVTQRGRQIDRQFGVNEPGISRNERQVRMDRAAEALKQYRTELYDGIHQPVPGSAPAGAAAPARTAAPARAPAARSAVPAQAAPALTPPTSAAPATPPPGVAAPTSQAEYDAIDSGTPYWNPHSNSVKIKP